MKKKKFFKKSVSIFLVLSVFFFLFSVPCFALGSDDVDLHDKTFYVVSPEWEGGLNYRWKDGPFNWSTTVFNFCFLFENTGITHISSDNTPAYWNFADNMCDLVGVNFVHTTVSNALSEWFFYGMYYDYEVYDSSITLSDDPVLYAFHWGFYNAFLSHITGLPNDFLFTYNSRVCSKFLINFSRFLEDGRDAGFIAFDGDAFELLKNSPFNSSGFVPDFDADYDFSTLLYAEVVNNFEMHFPYAPALDFSDSVAFVLDYHNWNWLPDSIVRVLLGFFTAVLSFGSIYGLLKIVG